MRLPEILAPAGSFDALVAAVENGANAVYLGGKLFSARAFADNFDDVEMNKAVEYAHVRNVCVYVTVNILIDNGELPQALLYVKKLYDLGVDGIIVQDLGLARMIRELLPEFPVHASTQMTVHNGEGVRFLEQMGVRRGVLARELSLRDLASIKKETTLDLEVFAHGALCISYSGQCLMSSLIGGRSGNRGRCAQPCRMTYSLVDDRGTVLSNKEVGEHLLSPRDLNTLELLPELCRLEIASLKFEGRMKRPEYVATVIRVYREALERLKEHPEEFYVLPEEERQLAQIFNRDFTTGYLPGNPGWELMSYKRPNNRGVRLGRIEKLLKNGTMAEIKLDEKLCTGDGIEIWVTRGGREGFFVSEIYKDGKAVSEAVPGEMVTINISGKPRVGDRIFKTHDARLVERAQNSYHNPQKFIPLNMKLTARQEQPVILEGWDCDGHRAQAVSSSYKAELALRYPATRETVMKQLDRLGGTSFSLDQVLLEMEEGLMIPASELNGLRRQVVAEIEKQRLIEFQYPVVTGHKFARQMEEALKADRIPAAKKVKISVRVAGPEEMHAAVEGGADIIYFGGEVFRRRKQWSDREMEAVIQLGQKRGCRMVYALPRVFHQQEKKAVYRMLEQASCLEADGLLTGNLGAVQAVREAGWEKELIGDFGLNVFNNQTIRVLKEAGLARVTLSPELTFEQISRINGMGTELECLVHGVLPMMVSAYCAIGAILGGRSKQKDCSCPCRDQGFGLKDRLNFIFPIETDQFCRMHIFNPKELCLITNLDGFTGTSVKVIRIEAERYYPRAVRDITRIYREVKEAWTKGYPESIDTEELQRSLAVYSPGGFTKGHYFRGVLE